MKLRNIFRRTILIPIFVLLSLLSSIGAETPDEGHYYSIRTPDRKLCLEIYGKSTSEGNGTWFNDCEFFTPKSSMFYFQTTSLRKEYLVISAISDLVLTANGAGMNLIQKKKSPTLSQVIQVESIKDNKLKLKFKKSGLYISGWGGITRLGSLPAEGNEQSNGSDEFILVEEITFKEIENYKNAKQLIDEAKVLAKIQKNESSCKKFLEAANLDGKDSYISNETSWWLLNVCSLPGEAIKVLELAENNKDRFDSNYARLVDAYFRMERWDEALYSSDKAINKWKKDYKNKNTENAISIQDELTEAYGRKANILLSLGKWKEAEDIVDDTLEEFPNTNTYHPLFVKCEILHIKAGRELESNEFISALKKINQCIELYKKNPQLSKPGEQRYAQLLNAKNLLEKRISLDKINPKSTLKVLALQVTSIDINQEIGGKLIQNKDSMREAMVSRYISGQQWYKLYLEVLSKGNLSLEIKNLTIGTATKLFSIPLKSPNYILEIDPNSITPSIATILQNHQNYDAFLFYWNGKSSKLNEGTGVAYVSWPLKLGGFFFGQPRGYSIMATNPEMYGVFDGLLHHEFGHLLEGLSNITFVHCQDMTMKDKSKPVYNSWNKSCDSIYDWVLDTAFLPIYQNMNWSSRFPADGKFE